MQHKIFNSPHKVELTLEERPTPKEYKTLPEPIDDTMTMWRVQTEGYTERTGQLIGVVSSDGGFLDSPDTEWISGGVNTKGPQAVAIGRHGNFFHWGFAVSPTYMTDEAKLVFINSVHYIAGFDGHAPVARKVDGVMPRSYLPRVLHGVSEEGYARTVAAYDEIRKDFEERKKAIQARIDAGEEVSQGDRDMLNYPPVKTPGRFDSIRRFLPAVAELGEDAAAVTRYVEENLPYVRPGDAPYTFVVDEDLKRLGVASHDTAFLDRAVGALKSGSDAKLGRTLLERYTDESFETAAEWTAWLEENRERLFFTEVGGYKWLVDTQAPRKSAKAAKPAVELKPTAKDPLDARLRVEPLGGGRFAVTVHVEILGGWHSYDRVPPGSAYLPLTVELTLPKGVKRVGGWSRPRSHPYPADPSVTVFDGRFSFRCELESEPSTSSREVNCTLSYQVCDARMCLPPATEELKATIPAREATASSGR